MEQRKLPNATIALVLSILSFIACCFSMGIGGLLFSGISLFLVMKDTKLYAENPDLYEDYNILNIAKIISIIGLIIAVMAMALIGYQIYQAGGWDAYQEQQMKAWEQLFGRM